MSRFTRTDFPVRPSLAAPAAPLESILRTEELYRRPLRPPDYARENRALVRLASTLADPQANILQTLADTILEVTQCDSSGLSLLTKNDAGKKFYWPAIAGAWKPPVGAGTPRDFGPCGDVLDQNRTLLFTHFERCYSYLEPVAPAAVECLLVPFYVGRKAVGTMWAISHDDRHRFDAEDERLMRALGQFTSLAHQALARLDDLKSQIRARERAEAAVRDFASGLQARIRRLVDSNIIGIFIWNLNGRIIDANEAFLRIIGYGRSDLVSGRVSWMALTPTEWRGADERRVAELNATGIAVPYEKEYFHKSGRRVPVLVGAASFEEGANERVAFVVDLADRKKAERAVRESERRYREIQMELAHANRVATMGQLSASIAHEVKQPVTAAVINADAALNWLGAQPPDVDETRQALGRIVNSCNRASEYIDRIRALIKKTPPRRGALEINETIRGIVALTHGELVKNSVSLQMELAERLPLVQADRVALQQVILNLIVNAVEAMSSCDEGPRELLVSTVRSDSDNVTIAVRDSGPGLSAASFERVFEAFYTTKPGGMGIGLSICRSIIEAHGGRLWVAAAAPRGAVFSFTLPAGTTPQHSQGDPALS